MEARADPNPPGLFSPTAFNRSNEHEKRACARGRRGPGGIGSGLNRTSRLRRSEKFGLAPSAPAPKEDDPGRCEAQPHPLGASPALLPARVRADLRVEPDASWSLGL